MTADIIFLCIVIGFPLFFVICLLAGIGQWIMTMYLMWKAAKKLSQ